MRRRDFIKVIAGSTAPMRLAVREQQRERVLLIGVLQPAAADEFGIG